LHFQLTGPEWLDYVPLLKQFVGLGRFAWAFFYVICVATIVLIALIRNPGWRLTMYVLACLAFLLEGAGYHQHVAGQIDRFPNYLDARAPENAVFRQLSDKINTAEYQAIIPLPFYHKSLTPGTFSETEKSIISSMRFAWITGLPLVSAVLSRYSISEGRHIIQLFAPNQYDKPIREAFPDQRPFLVLYTGEELEPLEREVFRKTDSISTAGRMLAGTLPFDSLFYYDHDHAAQGFLTVHDTFRVHLSGWHVSDASAHLEYDSFDSLPSPESYRGSGAWSGPITEEHFLFISEPLDAGKEYVLSFWYYNHLYDQVYNHMWVEEWDTNDKILNRAYHNATAGQVADGEWVWNEARFTPVQQGSRLVLRSKGEEMYAKTFYVDELMFREAGNDAMKSRIIDDTYLYLKNNQTIARLPH
jgi:hypothetical protein